MPSNALRVAMVPDTVEVICTSFIAQLDSALVELPPA
jgi:hypothetical protein